MAMVLRLFVLLVITVTVHATDAQTTSAESLQAPARNFLLISDIDDTVRTTHAASTIDKLVNGIKTDNDFAGMSLLYRLYSCQGLPESGFQTCLNGRARNHSDDRQVAYVTAVPSRLQEISKEFLRNTFFPVGAFFGREILENITNWAPYPLQDTYAFKVEKIQKLITDFPGHDVILVGDNGMKDTQVFTTVLAWARQMGLPVKITAHVHEVYGDDEGEPLGGEHLPYVTAGDLGLRLTLDGLIRPQDLRAVLSEVSVALRKNPESVFPTWMECRNAVPRLPEATAALDSDLRIEVQSHLEVIRQFCEQTDLF